MDAHVALRCEQVAVASSCVGRTANRLAAMAHELRDEPLACRLLEEARDAMSEAGQHILSGDWTRAAQAMEDCMLLSNKKIVSPWSTWRDFLDAVEQFQHVLQNKILSLAVVLELHRVGSHLELLSSVTSH